MGRREGARETAASAGEVEGNGGGGGGGVNLIDCALLAGRVGKQRLRFAVQVCGSAFGAQDVAVRALKVWRVVGGEGSASATMQKMRALDDVRDAWATGGWMRMVECCRVDLAAAACDDGGGGN
jgi:hypothetical protein